MPANSPRRRFRSELRGKVAIRSVLRGDSIWIRAFVFLLMSGIFFMLVTLTRKAPIAAPGTPAAVVDTSDADQAPQPQAPSATTQSNSTQANQAQQKQPAKQKTR